MRKIKTRATALAGTMLVGTLLTAACSSTGSGTNSPSTSPNAKTTVTVGLFGTFGYKEAGLFAEYMKLHPNIIITENSVEQEQTYWQALQTHLAAGSGLDDVQGIEVGRIADAVGPMASKWVNLNNYGAATLQNTFFPWKWQAATTATGSVIGLGTDTGPEAICYRPDLFKQAGLPTDPATLSTSWSTWQGYLAMGQEYEAHAPAKSAFMDSAAGLYNAILGASPVQYYAKGGSVVYSTNPAVKNAWNLSMQAIAAHETAKLSQFSPGWNQGFSTGAFATLACPAWMLGYIQGQAGTAGSGKWNVATIPGGTGNWGGSYLGIPAAAQHKKEAYDLIAWLTAPAQQEQMWTKAGHFPSSSTAAQSPAVLNATSSYFSNAPIGKIFSASAAKLPVQVAGPQAGTIGNLMANGIALVEQQGKSPTQAWSTTMANIANALG
ncbi:MAG: ABC transporter substrate-binding protein [Actinomycetes bacterium]